MKTFKNDDINDLPASLGLSLKTFCDIFGLNYTAMRKAASGHQELSGQQLSQWIAAKARVNQTMQGRGLTEKKESNPVSKKQIAKNLLNLAFEQMKFERVILDLKDKIASAQKGWYLITEVGRSLRATEARHCEQSAQMLVRRIQEIQKKLEAAQYRMYLSDCEFLYWQGMAQKTGLHPNKQKTPQKRTHNRTLSKRRSAIKFLKDTKSARS
jgi:hypothetical protein